MYAQQAKFLAGQSTGLWQWESAATLAVLGAVPNDKRDYKPDEKSRSAWHIAKHIVAADLWYLDCIAKGAFVPDPEMEKSGDQLAAEIDFFGIMKQPAASCIASGTNHSVHHRAQLGTYLRSMGSKVPGIYGPSADTPMGGQ